MLSAAKHLGTPSRQMLRCAQHDNSMILNLSSFRLTQQWPLIGAQHVELALVDRPPVVLQDATGIP